MPMYAGINGAVHKLTSLCTGISGAVTPMKEMWVGQNGANTKIFSSGTAIGDLPVGTVVQVPETSGLVDYIIVQQGLPSSGLYDSSCNGTWLWRVECSDKVIFDSSGSEGYQYLQSSLKQYMDSYYSLYAGIKPFIKNVKLPYYTTIDSVSLNGLTAYVFPLSHDELYYNVEYPETALDYFKNGAQQKRIKMFSGVYTSYWTRTPGSRPITTPPFYIDSNTGVNGQTGAFEDLYVGDSYGAVPTIIVDSSYIVAT